MSHKQAKAIRKEINYHPKDPRAYKELNIKNWVDEKGKPVRTTKTIELDPACSRSLYQEMKKESNDSI